MSFHVIYAVDSRAILVVDPVLDGNGQPVLPTDVQAAMATLVDSERIKLATPGSWFALSPGLATIVVTAIVQAPTPLRDAVVAAAQSSVGVTLANLSQAQRLALVACLLYRAGGLDPVTLAVRPLDQWLS